MDRTVPTSGNEEITLYIRTYYSLLRSSRAVPIRSLVEAHKRTNSALHVSADESRVDIAALVYSILRLPEQLTEHVELVVLGQSEKVFAQHGYPHVEAWQSVSAPARRRRAYWDGGKKLALFIASRSDIDDIIPQLTAYQIERDKLHVLLNQSPALAILEETAAAGKQLDQLGLTQIANCTGISVADLRKLQRIWQEKMVVHMLAIARHNCALSVHLLAGSFVEYKRATRRWWENIRNSRPDIEFVDRPIYFVSSNAHSLANLLSGYAQGLEPDLADFVPSIGDETLIQEYEDIVSQNVPSSLDNFLYYALKKFEGRHPDTIKHRLDQEEKAGITRVPSRHVFDVEAQIVEISRLQPAWFDPRLGMEHLDLLGRSPALIINIDYPLGMAAYQILSEIGRNIAEIRGVYIMGKAATLNGRIGDVMIPTVVHDEHSSNTYLFNNAFTADHVVPYLVYGTVLDNQKAMTAPGTFLQNHDYMSVFYHEGYTDLEMEAGPYLSCIYEMVRPRRYPQNEIVTLHHAPFPIGILHYASDTPFSKGMNLGTRNLSYFGMDPTYATTIALARAILEKEIEHMRNA